MAEYIEPLITCDRILNLFTPEHPAGDTHTDILIKLGVRHQTPEAAFVLAALHKLIEDKHLHTYGHANNLYRVTGTTFIFKANGGYQGEIERENEINEARTVGEKMALKSAKSVIDTNLSIQALNDSTTTFYNKQTKFNNWQKGLTIAIMLSTASYTLISYFMLRNQEKQSAQGTQVSQPTEKEIKLHILQDSVFLKSLKESLRKN